MPPVKFLFRVCALTVSAVAMVFVFSGCATASQPAAMTADFSAAAVKKHPVSASLQVSGGGETSAMGASNISNADFAAAIKSSIEQSGLFAKLSDDSGDYRLTAHIVRLDRPMFGASFTVELEVNWRLMRASDQKVVWEKAIRASFTATMGDAFVGTTRLRLANEGAARANIKDAIDQMSALTLP